MSIRCGNCLKTHSNSTEVKACSQISAERKARKVTAKNQVERVFPEFKVNKGIEPYLSSMEHDLFIEKVVVKYPLKDSNKGFNGYCSCKDWNSTQMLDLQFLVELWELHLYSTE
jgi:hypothetical protein